MSDISNREKLIELITDSSLTDGAESLLDLLLLVAEDAVRRKRYPFGDGKEDVSSYNTVILCVALELFGKLGAEGQTKHTEAGVVREWAEQSAALRPVLPVVKMI